MSEEQQAQADKNTKDIRSIKYAIPVVWAIGILIAGGGIVWNVAVRSTNKENTEANYKADNARQFNDMKRYIALQSQNTRTKDSTDIASVRTDMINLINTYQITTNGEIKLLREECRRSMNLSFGEHYHYNSQGKRVVTAVENR